MIIKIVINNQLFCDNINRKKLLADPKYCQNQNGQADDR
jgi:hypothetical protein